MASGCPVCPPDGAVSGAVSSPALSQGQLRCAFFQPLYERAAEFIEVAQKLWDSWQDDAVLADKAEGVWETAKRST